MGIVHRDELRAAFHQTRDEGNVAREAIELSDHQHGFPSPAQIECGDELRPIALSTAFNFRELLDQPAPAGDVGGNSRSLSFEAKATLPLPGSGDAIISDELGHTVHSKTVV